MLMTMLNVAIVRSTPDLDIWVAVAGDQGEEVGTLSRRIFGSRPLTWPPRPPGHHLASPDP